MTPRREDDNAGTASVPDTAADHVGANSIRPRYIHAENTETLRVAIRRIGDRSKPATPADFR